MKKKLHTYKNGNCKVTIYNDGTKTREWKGEAKPEFPESIDLKITDYCKNECIHCHESSSIKGIHAKVAWIDRVVSGLPRGVEIAIGGGDPLEYPSLDLLLAMLKRRGLVANMTINGVSAFAYGTDSPALSVYIKELRKEKLIYGLGVSWHTLLDTGESHWERYKGKKVEVEDGHLRIFNKDTIMHFIAGLHDPQDVIRWASICQKKWHRRPKVLILGFKFYGRGAGYDKKEIDANLDMWDYWLGTIMGKADVALDNLALQQLSIKERVPKKVWEKSYMGSDGRFSMYIDAVKQQYAISSTNPRIECGETNAVQMFKAMQQRYKNLPFY